MEVRRILSVDGGGSRGIVALGALSCFKNLEFDLMVGTSTGGIIVTGLGIGMGIEEISSIYYRELKNIFRGRRRFPFTLFRPEYKGENLREVLLKYLGGRKMVDVSSNVVLTTYAFGEFSGPVYLKSWKDGNIPLVDAIQMTAQAPVAHPLHEYGGRKYTDGGVFAKNPTLDAYAIARSLWPDDAICLFSIGTGLEKNSIKIKTQAGIIEWGKHIVNVFLDGQGDRGEFIMGNILGKGDEYYRINPPVYLSSTETRYEELLFGFNAGKEFTSRVFVPLIGEKL